jgi:DNA mismatch repair protein MutL
MINTPPDGVDVNVHPNKTQIKFLDSDVIYSLLVTAIKTAIGPRKTLQTAPYTEHSTPLIANDISQFSSLHLAQMSSPSSYSQENFPQQDESSLVIIDQSFCFFQKNSNHYLVNLQLLACEVVFSLVEKCLANEECISPLLVSEPFQVRNTAIDNGFEQMKKFGFEFDRLSSEVIILRTMPKNLPRVLLGQTALALIEYYINKQAPFSPSSFDLFFKQINFNIHLVKSLLMLNSTENNKSIVQLNKYNLGSFFK